MMRFASRSRISRLKSQLREYGKWISLAKSQTGKGRLDQMREILALRRLGGRCGVSDYYWHKLYDDSYLEGRGAKDFLGWRMQPAFNMALNPRSAVLPAWDKLTFAQIAFASGLPTAPIRAFFHPAAKMSSVLGPHLNSRLAVGKFLRSAANYPLFGKPAFSQQSYGSAYLTSYDRATDCLVLIDGNTIPVEHFLERLERTVDYRYHKPECGYLFQPPLTLAPEIRALTNWPAICGVRVVCLNGLEGAKPIRAAWKVTMPPNHMDNFGMGDHGNLLADVDLETGAVSKVIRGFWPESEIFARHPESGQSFDRFCLPGWDRLLDTCRLGGSVFPLMKIHHWDFAFTDHGPVIMELNDLGGTQIAQMHGRGLLTKETRDFLKRYGNQKEYPWIKRL